MSVRYRGARGMASGIVIGAFFFSCTPNRPTPDDSAPETSTQSSALLAAPGWSGTAAMSAERGQHAAVLLPTGKLLVINGVNRMGFVAASELYDPDTNTWTAAGAPGIQGNVTVAVLLPSGNVLALSDGSTTGALYDPIAGSWTPTGAMSAPRSLPTLTVLNNGKVLVAGGSNLASAELYDPETNTFSPTGSLSVVRRAFCATLLPSGQVLAVSGFNSTGEVPSADLYNPATGTWSAAAPPLHPRHYATSTLLPNGRVLVTGGFGTNGVLTQSELYDPGANTWTATGSLAAPRNGHAATLLPNGKLLVIGGSDGARNAQALSELYDPATGQWTGAGSLATARENATATLLPSGKVLLAGGFTLNPSVTFYASTELYDPGVNAWSAAGTPAGRLDSVAALLPSGKVLVAGGRNSGGSSVASAELYDRGANTWSAAAALATPRDRATATLLPNGKVLAAGGVNGASVLTATEQYDPVANVWSNVAAMTGARHSHTTTLLADGKVLAVGGQNDSTVLATAELYDPGANAWTAAGSIASARAGHAAVRLANGKVLVAGGRNSGGTAIDSAGIHDPATNTWTAAAPLAQVRDRLTLTLLPSGKVLAAGGVAAGAALASSEIYDPATNTWTAGATLAQARYGHTATLMPSGKVLLAGGLRATATFADVAETYDPTSREFTSVSAPGVRGGVVAAALPSGEVLVAGGTSAPTAQLYEDTRALAAWRPSVAAPSSLVRGCPAVLEGQGFRGISGASSGSYLDSSTNFPFVRMRAAEGGRLWTLPGSSTSATRATVTVPEDVPPGSYALSIFANAISGGRMVTVAPNSAPTAQAIAATTMNDTPVVITVTATDPDAGQALTYAVVTPPQHGTLSGSLPSVTYTPNAGYIGSDSFTYQARDCGLDSNLATVSITVQDRPPAITCPADVVIEATDASGAVATWPPATATDTDAQAPEITYSPQLGSKLPLGATTVTATAQDSDGNDSSCTFRVTVTDTTPPVITCPADVVVEATRPDGAAASWPPATATDTASTPEITYSHPLESTFPLGSTTVTAKAKDPSGNEVACTFDVLVEDTDGGSGGCGCRQSPSRANLSPLALVIGLAAWVGRRRSRERALG